MNPHRHSRPGTTHRHRCTLVAVIAVTVALGSAAVPTTAPAAAQAARTGVGGLKEVGRLPAADPVEFDKNRANGWLILNSKLRRAYEIFETGPTPKTVLKSFDLDTLKPIRRVEWGGVPVLGGTRVAGSGGGVAISGGTVHAVDEVAGKLYLAVSDGSLQGTAVGAATGSVVTSDNARPFGHIVEIDERAFEAGGPPSTWKRDILTPTDQALLPPAKLWLRGLDVVRPGGDPKLLLQFADPGWTPRPVYNHVLTQWDLGPISPATGTKGDWHQLLPGCSSDRFTSEGAHGMYQKNVLYRSDAVYLVCSGAGSSGRVVKVPLEAGAPDATKRPQQVFPFSRAAHDVLVDQHGQRLIIRSVAGGVTWWVFDARHDHYVAALAGALGEAGKPSAGIDPATGRLYSLVPNHGGVVAGRVVPQQGGLFVSDARLDPAPALQNTAPELAYPAQYRIVVDPPTRRVFVRRGTIQGLQQGYPDPALAPSPQEDFYRVFEDRIPLTEQPDDPGDAAFTTQVDEAPGRTSASYLGSASGFGSRLVLTGGVSAATQRLVDPAQSPCGPEDREITAGEVLGSTLSDLSVGAEATALGADPTTKQTTEKSVERCWPNPLQRQEFKHVPGGVPPQGAPGFDFDTDETDADPTDDFTSECVDDDTAKRAPRGGFMSEAKCEREKEKLRATAEGYFSPAFTQTLPNGTSDTLSSVRVGYSNSTVTIERDKQHGGVVATVDSIARNIEIPGVGSIGLVRVVATSRATGRVGGAKGIFTRTICGVDVGTVKVTHCISETDQQTNLEGRLNTALEGQGRFRFRRPDPGLLAGSAHGYQAGVQRDRLELFEDQAIARDDSQAVAGLEFVSYRGDDSVQGAGRQILQFAGVQASTTYGIACLLGRTATGSCSDGSYSGFGDAGGGAADFSSTDTDAAFEFSSDPGTLPSIDMPVGGTGPRGGLGTLVRRLLAVPADVLRLLFASPREFALMAAVWALLWAPCYLGERRRTLVGLARGRPAPA